MTWTEDSSGNMVTCGEACIPYGKFWEYEIFEKHLEKAGKGGDEPVCLEAGFYHFTDTIIHEHGAGLWNLKFDFYDKSKVEEEKPVADPQP